MNLPSRQKLTIISLLIYWPAIFIVLHIPIPDLIYQANVSDKALHFLVYLILASLLWFAARPEDKVNWRKRRVWWVVLAAVIYGVTDEITQCMVGRSCDIADFFANIAGVFSGLRGRSM